MSQTARFNFLQTQLSLNLAKKILVKSYAVYRTLQWASVSPDLETTVVSAGKVGGGGRGRKRRREAVGEGSRRVEAGDKPAARKRTARGSRGGAGVSPRDLGQRGAGGAGQNRDGAEVGVGGHVDAAAGGRHGVHGSGAKGAGGRGGAVRAGVG